jgi:uncharacterized protein
MSAEPFWQNKPLNELSDAEWELLCDGCGKCCLAKLEDSATGEVHYTRVACRLLDIETCVCRDYERRLEKVKNCVHLSKDNIDNISWLPGTCAYRLRHEGKQLFEWHPLVSGSRETVHKAGISVQGWALAGQYVHPDGLSEHIVQWVD